MKKLIVNVIFLLTITLAVASPSADNKIDYSENVSLGNYLQILCDFLDYEAYEAGRSEHWATPYADIAYSYCWTLEYHEDLDENITMYEASVFLLEALGVVPNYWLSEDSPFSDTDDEVACTMYDIGFYQGERKNGRLLFSPNSFITYQQVTDIFENVNRYFEEDYMVTDFRYLQKQVPEPSYYGETTVEYFQSVFEYLILNDLEDFEMYYEDMSMNYFERRIEANVDTGYANARDISLAELGMFFDTYDTSMMEDDYGLTVILAIDNSDFPGAEAVMYKYEFILALEEILEEIVNSGDFDMRWSDYDKAKYFYEWCILNYEYDDYYEPISYTGYGIIYNGVGVCQAYVAIFNSLCKMVGIEIEGAFGTVDSDGVLENHIWSYANLDGKWSFIDPTWGDDGDSCDWDYFAVSKRELSRTHTFESH